MSLFDELDARADSLSLAEVRVSLHTWERSNPSRTPEEDADVLALSLMESSRSPTKWGSHYGPWATLADKEGNEVDRPALSEITPAVIDSWKTRALQAKNPLLKFRYSDLVWDLAKRASGSKSDVAFAQLAMDAGVEAIRSGRLSSLVDAKRIQWRCVILALKTKDLPRLQAILDATLAFEQQHARDLDLVSWGTCMDLILDHGAKFSESQTASIVDDLERRLERLAAFESVNLDPVALEAVAGRLARYYRRSKQRDDECRVLRALAAAVRRVAEARSGMFGAAWIESISKTLVHHGLPQDAAALEGALRAAWKSSADEMVTVKHSQNIPVEEVEAFTNEVLGAKEEERFLRIAAHFLPRREETERRVKADAEVAPMFADMPKKIVDSDGRTVAIVGAVDDDLDGNVVWRIGQDMSIGAFFLHHVLSAAIERGYLAAEVVAAGISASPAFQQGRHDLLAAGVGAYREGRRVEAVHLLVPQIEAAVRHIADLSGTTIYRRNKLTGFLDIRPLHDLLRDEGLAAVLGDNVVQYLRVLLVDVRGWNLRNEVCHGQLESSAIEGGADRVMHALMVLMQIRQAAKSE